MKQNWNGDNDEGWLDPGSYDALSDYLAKFIEAYKAEGLDVWGVTGGNEVIVFAIIPMAMLPKSMRLNGTMMSADTQRDWVKRLKPRIGSDVKFITMDDCRSFLDYWMKRIEMDEEALEAVDGVALHWYYDWMSSPTALDEFHERYPNKLILYTESSINTLFGDPRPVVLGSWERAEYYIHNIIENLNHWTQAYMDWNLALDPNGGPFMALALDAAVIINATSGEFYKQPIFYSIGHFSKFISPGSKRVWTSWNQQVARNRRSDKKWTRESKAAVKSTKTPLGDFLTIPLPTEVECLATSGPDGRRTVFVFNPQNVSQDVRIEDSEIGMILTTVEENSINSFIYWSS